MPFLTPGWVAFEQGRANSEAWTGLTTPEIRTATDSILADLVFGGGFAAQVRGQPVLHDRERAHMADVRTVFRGLWVLTVTAIAVLVVAGIRADPGRRWRAVRRGALGLAVGVGVAGVVGVVAFDQLFEVFHEVFFPAGSFLFDPATDRLVQLFPFQFWQETAMVVGAVIIVGALAVAAIAGRHAHRKAEPRATRDLSAVSEPGS